MSKLCNSAIAGRNCSQLALRLWALAICVIGIPQVAIAQFYIGPSYLLIPDQIGDVRQAPHKGWIRTESRYWFDRPALPEIRGIQSQKNDLLFTGSPAPKRGPSVLSVAIDKRSLALPALMDRCREGKRIDELQFSESSETARHPQEHGPRPRDVPEFYRYALIGVQLSCPVVPDAPEQAIRLRFEDIRWLNHSSLTEPRAISAQPAKLPALKTSGRSRVFAVSWFAAIANGADNRCPRMNSKPGPAEYFALLPGVKATAVRAELADKGISPELMPYRGPDEMNVGLMPGIVRDPGHVAPLGEIVEGLDLDGASGDGAPPRGIRKHQNFVAPDGRRGIDNQLFTVEGCVEGLGRKGFLPMIFNEGRAVGRPTALIQVSGIDDDRNDPEIWVTVLYSSDPLQRSPAKIVLPDFTYRVSTSPEYTQDFVRFRGRLIDGIVSTDPIESFHMHEVTGIETTILKPRLRLTLTDDGHLKGVVGGFVDWRKRWVFQTYRSSDYENTVGYQAPAIYNAMKRAADGLQDPATGEFTGISAAFEIEGVAAFIPPTQQSALLATGRGRSRKNGEAP